MVVVVVFEEAGAAGSLEPESKSRLLVSGFTSFGGATLTVSSTTTIKINDLALEEPATFCADVCVESSPAFWAKLVIC
jgi:hypothetical protein